MKIRNASSADKDNISRLHVASIRKLCANHYTREQIDAWTSVLTPSVYDQALKEKVFLVAYDSQQDLLGIGIFDVEMAEVSAIYIRPDAAGRGIGSKLLYPYNDTYDNIDLSFCARSAILRYNP